MEDYLSHNLNVKTTQPKKRVNTKMHSVVIEEVLKITYPNFQNMFSYKKAELYQLIFNYFFNDDEDALFEIEMFSNFKTACHIKGLRFVIRKESLKSYQAFDKYMATIKEKSLNALSLTNQEMLNDEQKNNVIGGREKIIPRYFPIHLYDSFGRFMIA